MLTLIIGIYVVIGYAAYSIADLTLHMCKLMDREFNDEFTKKELWTRVMLIGVLWPVTIWGVIKMYFEIKRIFDIHCM